MPDLRSLSRRRPLIALVVLILLLVIGYGARAVNHTGGSSPRPATRSSGTAPAGHGGAPLAPGALPASSASGQVALSSLPAQARVTVALIEQGGPFPYGRDGAVFDNAERHLPLRPTGYYHEYTVITPGSSDRGTRRVITGDAGEFYYTGDHYATFARVDPSR